MVDNERGRAMSTGIVSAIFSGLRHHDDDPVGEKHRLGD